VVYNSIKNILILEVSTVIKPSEVKETFKRIKDENYAFRAYLKNHADEEKMDEQFLKCLKD